MRTFRHAAAVVLTLVALPVACCASIAGGVAGATGAALAGLMFAASRLARPAPVRRPPSEPDPHEIAARYREDIAARRQMS